MDTLATGMESILPLVLRQMGRCLFGSAIQIFGGL
jgi:hypothetical protein